MALHKNVAPDPTHLARARALGERLEATFWHPGEGGFNLEAGVEQVMAIYASWLTPSLLDLYRQQNPAVSDKPIQLLLRRLVRVRSALVWVRRKRRERKLDREGRGNQGLVEHHSSW